ncbi:glutamine synthetase [Pseudonocardia autotrophica]|nr:glutamine synthetase [Pseudonocardia autotrophica]
MADKTESLEEVRRVVEDNDIEFIFASFSEVRGKSSAKLVPVSQLDTLFGAGVGFAGYAAGEIGQGPHSPDIELIPDPATLRIVPWRPGLAHLIGDARVDGGSWPYCPRSILRRQIARAAELGYEFRIGFEAEFMLVDHDENGKLVVADRHDTWPKPCYDVKGLTRQYDFVTQLSRYVTGLGWENYAVDHEDANGQFECNVTFADALETADRAVFFRYMVETVAQQHDMIATFMPKPFTDNTGNGFHYTMSLWDPETETNLFEDPQDPLGLSQLGYRFAAGILDHARGYAAMVAPTVNSYKRMKAGTDAIRTWVPVAMAYGGTTVPRCCGSLGRVRSRTAHRTSPEARTWGSRRRWRRVSTVSSATCRSVNRTPRTSTSTRRASSGSAVWGCCPAACWRRSTTWRRTTCSGRRSGRCRWTARTLPARSRTSWTTTRASSATSSTP